MHGISEQEWIDYLDLAFNGSGREHVDSHLAGCAECRELYERLSLTVQSLHEAGGEVSSEFPLEKEQLFIGLTKVLARALDNCAGIKINEVGVRTSDTANE